MYCLLILQLFHIFSISLPSSCLSLSSPFVIWSIAYIFNWFFFCSRIPWLETPTVEHPGEEGDHVERGFQSHHHCQLLSQWKVCCGRHLWRKMYLLHYRGEYPVTWIQIKVLALFRNIFWAINFFDEKKNMLNIFSLLCQLIYEICQICEFWIHIFTYWYYICHE